MVENNGGRSLAQIEEDLYGPVEDRRRPGRLGLMERVRHLEEERVSHLEGRMAEREAQEQQVQAVGKAKRYLITTAVTVGVLMLTLIGLMVRIMGAVS